jgi:hypothetical protein
MRRTLGGDPGLASTGRRNFLAVAGAAAAVEGLGTGPGTVRRSYAGIWVTA